MFNIKLKQTFAVLCFSLAASSTFAAGVTLKNQVGSCVRAYVDGRQIDAKQGETKTFNTTNNKYYMVSVFKGSSCGGAAARNVWFNGSNAVWLLSNKGLV